MNYCEYQIVMYASDPRPRVCDKPATVRIGGKWYCEDCADAVEVGIADEIYAMKHKTGPYRDK